jgi:hypothetical protein
MALPFLEAMGSASLRAAPAAAGPRRFVAINIPLGFIPEQFFPKGVGSAYEASSYLELAEPLRKDFTVFSGVSHPDVDGGHSSEKSFLTAAPHPGSRSFKNSISLDQVIAREVGEETRFSSLTMGSHSLSWSANGVATPADRDPRNVFRRLFQQGTPQDVAALEADLRSGHSIMDAVMADAKAIQRKASAIDQEKLDQYFTAVRETEQRLAKAERWNRLPKPEVDLQLPDKIDPADLVAEFRAYFDLMHLAIQTDSTRVLTLGGAGHGLVPKIRGVAQGYHALSHHGKNPELLSQLEIIERCTMEIFVDFLQRLKKTAEGDSNLLDRTQVLFGSNLGNASGHTTTNLPILLAGGGFRHGQHLAFDARENYPLPNLFVSILQRMGIESDSFASSTGTMSGLEMAGA